MDSQSSFTLARYWVVFGLHLVFSFIIFHLVAFIDFKIRQNPNQSVDENGEELPLNVKYYPASFWYLLKRWIEFLYPFLSLWMLFSTFGTHFFFNEGKSTVTKTVEYVSFVLPAMALLGIPIMIVRHFFGHRIGLRLFLYPEFGVTSERLYYRFFVRWYSAQWSEIQLIQPIKDKWGRTHGFNIRLKSSIGIPTYPMFQIWKQTKTSNLIFYCLLPNALELNDAILSHSTRTPASKLTL